MRRSPSKTLLAKKGSAVPFFASRCPFLGLLYLSYRALICSLALDFPCPKENYTPATIPR